jgi:imidazolonepropionase-like amidohydrolase
MTQCKWLYAGWFLDGTGTPVKERIRIKIQNGVIRDIQPYDPKALEKLSDVPFLDFSEYTLLPGLMDCHVHLFMSGTDDVNVREFQLRAGFEDTRLVISNHLNQHASRGIIAVRDGGDGQGHVIRYKQEILKPGHVHVRLAAAGKAWKRSGRYGKLIARSLTESQPLGSAIESDLRNTQFKNPDHIKIVNSGLNSLKEFGKQTPPQFHFGELKEAISVASRYELPVMVHANGKLPVGMAVEAGACSIEHGFFMGRENLEKMADRRTFWVPTAVTMKMYASYLNSESGEADIAKQNLDHQLEQLDLARCLGVQVAVGTDAGSLGVHHGTAVVEEMRLLLEAGFSLPDTVRCATQNASKLLRMTDVGVLSPGKEATFIAVNGSPKNLMQNLGNPDKIFIMGREF